MSDYRTVCRTSDVPEGEARMVQLDDQRLAVIHLGGQFYVLDDECPHAGASLARGYLQPGHVTCRIHHWRFCLSDGHNLDQPGPPRDATAHRVRVVGDLVQVQLVG